MKNTAFQLAARLCKALRGQDDGMVAVLLWEGANPNLVLPEGMAPMHLAAGLEQENGTRGLHLLLQHGGDPNVRSGEGLTPLHVAASWGCPACLTLLLTEGGDPHLEDQDGNSAFDLAVEQGNERCAHILQDGGWTSDFSERRAESFLTTISEEAGQTGPDDSLPCPPDRRPLSSLKEARPHRDPPAEAAPNGAPELCTRDWSAASFLTEGSWRGDTVVDLADFGAQPADSPDAFPPPRELTSSRAHVQTPWDGEAESTAVSDLGKVVVVESDSVLGVSGTLDGCSVRGKSPGRCSTASVDRFLSCVSECSISAAEGGPGDGCGPEWESRKAALPKSGCNSGSGGGSPACVGMMGLHGQRSPPTRGAARIFPRSWDLALPHSQNPWEGPQGRAQSVVAPPENGGPWEGSVWGPEGPTEIRGLHVGRQGPSPSGAREGVAEVGRRGEPSSSTQDTVPVQWASEERDRSCGCRGQLGPSSTLVGTGRFLDRHTSIGEEPPCTLDAQLRSMMLATRVALCPLLSLSRKGCPASPKSPLVGTLPQQSLTASSLFEEPLEMPRRPRRVRKGPGPASPRGAAGFSRSPPSAREEAEQTGEGRTLSAVPSSRKPSSNPGPGSWGHSLASSRGDVGKGEGPSGRADLGAGKPPPGGAARSCPEVGQMERLSARAEKISTVSFSRMSGRGPSATSPPGSWSPIQQQVPLSPGGRPTNLSTTEPVEYLYVDEEEGQTLIERHLPPTDDSGASSSEDTLLLYDWQACARATVVGRQADGDWPPLNPEYLTDGALARKLRELGADPGPVTSLTRKLYVRLLERLIRDPETLARKGYAAYSPELTSALRTYRIPTCKADEMALAAEFDQPDKSRRWREGLMKSSFNYLLLDPRVTQNLPACCQLLSPAEAFRVFVRAIFYVGKGTRSRPYCHLYEALTHHRQGQGTPTCRQVSSKVQHILDIWAGGQGVVSMHCFQNVVPVEAYTREACMVDAIGLKMLTNQKKGNYYGLVSGWPVKRRRALGVFLLHRALRIFLAEGERQLRPADI
ncbi:ankyrin repeat and LEM domain-containing protein 1 isoform X2 [Erythrolamprus reginae]|uniref:ankyrin repeat and LEM domain-containing protein 1 isoform X2 n=1 Tax=Erythrolamprus reginae TaxID=121349 RepID=UPI00396C85F2